ncbi:MAG: alpha/beta hydrolase [Planctomycetaceae bacterium]|nr:alpha/beta hydrolase [Planctomycetaceae bacterium]
MALHPESELFLAAVAARDARAWYDMPVAEARDTFDHLGVFGDGPDLFRVADGQTASGVRLRVYQPDSTPDETTVVYFHGGGWVLGNIETHDTLCRRLAATARVNVVSVEYRCAPEHACPAALDDCLEATQLLVQDSQSLGLHSTRVVVAGDSAGGNLACGVAMKCRDAGMTLAGQVLIYPVVSPNFSTPSYQDLYDGFGLTRQTMMWFWEQYLQDEAPGPYVDLLSKEADHSDLPPAFVMIAEYDVLRSECETLAQVLVEAGNRVTSQNYAGLLHGFVHFSEAFPSGVAAIADISAAIHQFS